MPLPASATKDRVVALLHDREFLIKMDKELTNYEKSEPPKKAETDAATEWYKITNTLKDMPSFLNSNNVTFSSGFKNLDNGVQWTVHAPLGLTQESSWYVEEVVDGEKTGLCLVQDVETTCNRIMMGSVKSKCEESWDRDVVPTFNQALTA